MFCFGESDRERLYSVKILQRGLPDKDERRGEARSRKRQESGERERERERKRKKEFGRMI